MRSTVLLTVGLAAAVLTACAEKPTTTTPSSSMNPLLTEWTGPYGGVPAFDAMDLADIDEAVQTAIDENLAEIEAIATNPEPPTFENTIVAREKAGELLRRVQVYYGIWSRNLSSEEFRQHQATIAPKLADLQTKIFQNQALFERIQAVHDGEEVESLSPEKQRLVQLIYDSFALNGATLDPEAKARYAEIQLRLAELHTQFSAHVLADEEKYIVLFDDTQLGGLSQALIDKAAKAAAERGHEGQYAVLNTRSSADPFLASSDERALREQVWRNFVQRGDNGDENDNNALIAEILALRDERVGLLGFDTYAEWRLQDRMAKTPEAAMGLLEAVWPAAIARVEEEVADMQAIADAEGAGIQIEPWDYRYYAEKVRKAKYDLDSVEISQYLQLDNLREAMFYVAGELFGFAFTPVTDGSVPVYHPDVKVWEVTDKASGNPIGLWYLDPYARPGKRSGAWAISYRGKDRLDGDNLVLSSNNSNFVAGEPGEPILVSWDDATTFFHEFGHALHALSADVDYPTFNDGVRDYTEFQSQLLERWIATEPVIEKYLLHVETGEPMPDELVEKIRRAATFNQGFSTTEYLASALMDMAYHTTDPEGLDPKTFEKETLDRLGLPKEIAMRHRSTHFSHIFSSEGYATGYYGYMWADVLTSDAAEAFQNAPGGFYDADLASKLVEHLFAPRNSVDPGEAYRAFRGRDAELEALLRDRGFPVV